MQERERDCEAELVRLTDSSPVRLRLRDAICVVLAVSLLEDERLPLPLTDDDTNRECDREADSGDVQDAVAVGGGVTESTRDVDGNWIADPECDVEVVAAVDSVEDSTVEWVSESLSDPELVGVRVAVDDGVLLKESVTE
jgi:hypothetical protein